MSISRIEAGSSSERSSGGPFVDRADDSPAMEAIKAAARNGKFTLAVARCAKAEIQDEDDRFACALSSCRLGCRPMDEHFGSLNDAHYQAVDSECKANLIDLGGDNPTSNLPDLAPNRRDSAPVAAAKRALERSQFGRALRHCEQELSTLAPDASDEREQAQWLCGLTACSLRLRGKARRFYDALQNEDHRAHVETACGCAGAPLDWP